MHFFDHRTPRDCAAQVFTCPGQGRGAPTVLCTALHPDEHWPVYAGTDQGNLVVWDTRRPELPAEAVPGAGAGAGEGTGAGAPIHALCTTERGSGGEYRLLLADDSGSVMARGLELPASGAGGGLLSSGFLASPWAPAARAGSEGPRALASSALGGPHCHISPRCALVNKAHTPLTGLTFISSGRQRQLGRSEGFALAAAPTGALECALLPGV